MPSIFISGFKVAHEFVRGLQNTTDIKPLPVTHNTLLNALVKEGGTNQALEYFTNVIGITGQLF